MKYWYDKETKTIINEVSNVQECLRGIQMIGFEYDGCVDVKSLKDVIDTLVQYAKAAEDFLLIGQLTDDDDTDIDDAFSYEKAKKDREEAKLNEIK